MTHSHRRTGSRFMYFRKDVPKDIRALVGKTSWQHTLATTDLDQAKLESARWTAHYAAEVIRFRAENARIAEAAIADQMRRAFVRLARYFGGSMDDAVACQLRQLAQLVRGSWSLDHHRAVETHHGILPYDQPGEESGYENGLTFDPVLAIEDEQQQRLFVVRAELFERQGAVEGIVYQELARALIDRRQFEAIRGEIGYLPGIVPEMTVAIARDYDAVAAAYLETLSSHTFTNWPQDIRTALAPVAAPATAPVPAVSQAVPTPPSTVSRTVRDGLEAWKRGRKIVGKDKTADEFETAITRFEALFGIVDVTAVTSKMVKDFRNLVGELPSRPNRAVASLPIREQIATAKAKDLPLLMPPTVGKQVAGLKAALSAAVEEEWINTNPAEGVVVEGAKWVGDERDHFSDDDMRRIYSSPLMTDPDACDDTMFWILFLAPFHGSRPGEHCKLKPEEIVKDDGQWVMRFRRDRRSRLGKDGVVRRPRRQKTTGSIRDVPLHWIVLVGGFLDFCRMQRERHAEWLFADLVPDAYDDRYKALSRRINRALRKVGIDDPNKSFYSTRHTMKREGRRQRVDAGSLNQMTGHVTGHAGDKYGQGSPIETRKDDIDRLEFRSVQWDAVVASARARVARLMENQRPADRV